MNNTNNRNNLKTQLKAISAGANGGRARTPLPNGLILIFSVSFLTASLMVMPQSAEALWFFQQQNVPLNQTLVDQVAALQQLQQKSSIGESQISQETTSYQQAQNLQQASASSYSPTNYASSLLSIAGIQPSRIASILNTVGETGFTYFNIQDQCRNRAACDLGHMLYRRLSFVHNWLIRTSVRTLTDMNNVYTQSWMEGMLGRNCTAVYLSCRQSPLEGLMNVAFLQHLAS